MASQKVLIIDDEASLLWGLKGVMARAGYVALTAPNGMEGIRIALEETPDLIVCDLMMPPPNGFELKQMLNANPKTANIPLIYLTARTSQADKLHGLEIGADDYITKPFDRQELLARVNAVLRRKKEGRGPAG